MRNNYINHGQTKDEHDFDMDKDRSKRAIRRQNKKRFDKEDRYD